MEVPVSVHSGLTGRNNARHRCRRVKSDRQTELWERVLKPLGCGPL